MSGAFTLSPLRPCDATVPPPVHGASADDRGMCFVGVATWLTITAARVVSDPNGDGMCHLRMRIDTRELVTQGHPIQGVFWPRYWRRLLGQPWPGTYVCSPACRERHERIDGHPLFDMLSGDGGFDMLAVMGQLDRPWQEERVRQELARMKEELEAKAKASLK